MNRLRRAYLELDPGAGQHFVTSSDPGRAGVLHTMGLAHLPARGSLAHGLAVLPVVLSILLAVVAGVVVALLVGLLGAGVLLGIGAAVLTFALAMVGMGVYNRRRFRSSMQELERQA